jgi:hypothetical protein
MYGKELADSGVYGIKDIVSDKMVYVGATKVSFVSRWGQHIDEYKRGKHCNKELSKLFKSKKYEFVILEVCNSDKKKLNQLEKKYINIYNVLKDGYNMVGSGELIANKNKCKVMPVDDNVLMVRFYIMKNWYNKSIDNQDKIKIENYIKEKYNISSSRFKDLITKLGFNIQTSKDRRIYYING